MNISRSFSKFFLASPCLCCKTLNAPLDPWLCPSCKEKLRLESAGLNVTPDVFSFFMMGEVSRSLIHGLKYSSMPGIASYLIRNSGLSLALFKEWLPSTRNLYFVPVPLHPARFRERGYNQTERVANALAALCGGKVLKILKRRTFKTSQTKLSKSDREFNVAGVFYATPKAEKYKDALLIVVDDVFTTGATTRACLYALKHAGIENTKICTLLYEQSISARIDFVADFQEEWRV